MLNKIKYDDDRGWSIAFARCASKQNKINAMIAKMQETK